MPLPSSRKQIDRLGERIAATGQVSEDDRPLFADTLDFYQELLDAACDILVEIGLTPTSRVKTTGTLTEKLQREHGIKLSRIQDVAGARVVITGDMADQDGLAKTICDRFSDCPRQSEIVDRRKHPRQGYRAVHVIVYPQGFPVEIQVRTELQDIWAQIFERTADQWGRQIRYGEPPDPPQDPSSDASLRPRTVDLLMDISEAIHTTEERRTSARSAGKLVGVALVSDPQFTEGKLSELPTSEASRYLELRHHSIEVLQSAIPDKRRRGRVIRQLLPRYEVKLEGARKAMQIVGGFLSDDMLKLIEKLHEQELLLRQALDHAAQISEEG